MFQGPSKIVQETSINKPNNISQLQATNSLYISSSSKQMATVKAPRSIMVTLFIISLVLFPCVADHTKDPGVGGRKAVVTAGGLVKCPHCACCKPPPTPNSCCKCCDSPAENTANSNNGFP
ncbi:uncharacterized protein LOC131181009 [Hevea brasiliensis]|uniref:uncharacterized protein LOC131181009 n=1 Tax=Hevea brasiliensis TaxID=3981 RepID=UPI0025DEC96D|nr:uncharacterized protein LOC131181009 [Hevea brasiliensis]